MLINFCYVPCMSLGSFVVVVVVVVWVCLGLTVGGCGVSSPITSLPVVAQIWTWTRLERTRWERSSPRWTFIAFFFFSMSYFGCWLEIVNMMVQGEFLGGKYGTPIWTLFFFFEWILFFAPKNYALCCFCDAS